MKLEGTRGNPPPRTRGRPAARATRSRSACRRDGAGSVVLPNCRGPVSTTAGNSAAALSLPGSNDRSMYLAFLALDLSAIVHFKCRFVRSRHQDSGIPCAPSPRSAEPGRDEVSRIRIFPGSFRHDFRLAGFHIASVSGCRRASGAGERGTALKRGNHEALEVDDVITAAARPRPRRPVGGGRGVGRHTVDQVRGQPGARGGRARASWDQGGVASGAVLFDGTTYHMWYGGFPTTLRCGLTPTSATPPRRTG